MYLHVKIYIKISSKNINIYILPKNRVKKLSNMVKYPISPYVYFLVFFKVSKKLPLWKSKVLPFPVVVLAGMFTFVMCTLETSCGSFV